MSIILQKIHRKSTRWKNGGGSTVEVIVVPTGAGFDDFDWRISLATIAQSGSFSVFPGIDRTLVLVDGGGLALQIDAAPPFNLHPGQPLIRFRGEAAVDATLASGATTDFNVMTRRSTCSHQVEMLTFSGSHRLTRRSGSTLLFLAGGDRLTCRHGEKDTLLHLHDALLLTADDAAEWTLQAAATVTLFIAHITENSND